MKRVETLRAFRASAQLPGAALSLCLWPRSPLEEAAASPFGLTAQQLRTLSCMVWKG